MNDNLWHEVEFLSPPTHTGYPHESLVAKEKSLGDWWLVVDWENMPKNRYRFETACSCNLRTFRTGVITIPEDVDTVVIGCLECRTPNVRISGFCTKEWKMWVHDSIKS